MEGQLNIFDCFGNPYKITKPIRLIEIFAGIGSQAMSLRDLGAKFEHYRVIEFDKYAIASYNAIHGTNFTPTDVKTVKGVDLGIVNKLAFTYLLIAFHVLIYLLRGKCWDMQKAAAPGQVFCGK